jgi:UDP-N-acetylmuramyl pentapeptide phosphotransferase/UDP-N-acetylglucosamine-1-phosphate transferase
MGCSAIALSVLGVIGLVVGTPAAAALAFCTAAALVGFLIWNFPQGRLFAGDAGSLFTGAMIAAVGLILIQDGGVSPIIPVLATFPMLADVLLTLAWRVGRKRSDLFSGHREHLFQIGLRAGLSHTRVSLVYWMLSAHCGLIALVAVFTERVPNPEAFLPQAGDVAPEQAMFVYATAWLAALTPVIALVALAMVSVKVSGKIRAFAISRGLDGPQ